jgi:SNF2 family DNA or RNA helicase
VVDSIEDKKEEEIMTTDTAYKAFLEKKKHSTNNYGIDPIWLPERMFDYQKYVTEYAIKKGRCGIFLDTGLGKSLCELTIAYNYVRHTNKPVLIITPLAVAFQFLKEAQKFGIDDIEYSKHGKFRSKIVICNYERLQYFNHTDFDCVLLDESSILKNFDGSIKQQITSFIKNVKYRYLFTATPSPNDFIELGTSSEALGYLGYTDMLTKFFTNNEDTISPQNIGTQWVLKGHAREAFFQWVSGWSISMRRPSDLGFDDSTHLLPELAVNEYCVENTQRDELFDKVIKTLPEIKAEQRQTLSERCEKAVEVASEHNVSVYWTNLNDEADLIQKLDKNSFQIKGSMDIDKKEDLLLNFLNGNIKKLITKPKITAFGLNWQHCNHTVYFPTFSYEQYYQAIRRFWRFGQTEEVNVDLVFSSGQRRMLESLLAKAEKANELFSKLNANLNKSYEVSSKGFDKKIALPEFVKGSLRK